MKQAGLGSDRVVVDDPTHVPVFFLDGETHRRKRAAIARFFTPKAIATRHRAVMERASDELLQELRKNGSFYLDQAAWRLAVIVASEVVGLDNSRDVGMARRIEGVLGETALYGMGPLRRFFSSLLVRAQVMHFFFRDVRPTIKARRTAPREDIISHLLEEGYSEKAILVETMTYSAAGMATTREFIVMVAWHLFDNAAIRKRFCSGTEEDQFAILEEILRLEPVATLLYRRADEGLPDALKDEVSVGAVYAIDMRSANVDETATGPCPFAIDPDRAKRMKISGSYLSFGDGPHRCPGAQVALNETRIFIDRLFRIQGVRLAKEPRMLWNPALLSYELRDALVVCDGAPALS